MPYRAKPKSHQIGKITHRFPIRTPCPFQLKTNSWLLFHRQPYLIFLKNTISISILELMSFAPISENIARQYQTEGRRFHSSNVFYL